MVRATGGCLCGAVRYEVTGPLRDVVVCHCSRCLRAHGTPAGYTRCAAADLAVRDGGALARYAADGRTRSFCSRCGAALFWRRDGAGTVSIAAGTLDQPTGLAVIAHIHTREPADWDPVAGPGERHLDGLP